MGLIFCKERVRAASRVCARLSGARREQSAAERVTLPPKLNHPRTHGDHDCCPRALAAMFHLQRRPFFAMLHEPEVNLPSAHLLPCMPGAVWLRPTVAASILPEHPFPLASRRKPLNRRSNCGTHIFPLPGHRAMISSRPRTCLFPVAIGYSPYLAVRHALTPLESLRFLRRVAASQNNP